MPLQSSITVGYILDRTVGDCAKVVKVATRATRDPPSSDSREKKLPLSWSDCGQKENKERAVTPYGSASILAHGRLALIEKLVGDSLINEVKQMQA